MPRVDVPKRFTKGQMDLQKIIEEVGFETLLEEKFGKYYVDIYLPELNIAVEYDGPYHVSKKRDLKRDTFLFNRFGIRVLRITDLKDNVKQKIKEFVSD